MPALFSYLLHSAAFLVAASINTDRRLPHEDHKRSDVMKVYDALSSETQHEVDPDEAVRSFEDGVHHGPYHAPPENKSRRQRVANELQARLDKQVGLREYPGDGSFRQSLAKQRNLRKQGPHFLTKTELQPLRSIRCLEEKQMHPDRPCPVDESDLNSFNIGHFPSYTSTICRSQNEYYCDPAGLLSSKERDAAHRRMAEFRDRTFVNCSIAENGDMTQVPFKLAVVVGDKSFADELDPQSMQYFGNAVMSQWGLMPKYNGVDYSHLTPQYIQSTCPNAAVLFVLPRYRQAFLESPSCDFICPERGGQEVVAATLAGLDRGGVERAIEAGIDEIEHVLKSTSAQRLQPRRPEVVYTAAQKEADAVRLVRIIYAGVIVSFLFSVGVFVYYLLLPDKNRSLRSYYSMTGQNGRRYIQESLAEG